MGIMRINGALSDEVNKYRTNWNLVDDTSDKIDQLTISFNASRMKTLPPYGAEYELFIHDSKRGKWSIISSTVNLANVMTIKLSTVAKYSAVKEKSIKQFNSMTIKMIVEDVVKAGGYTAAVDPVIGAKVITAAMRNESAGEFLNRLASEYDAVSKPYNKVWMFKPRLTKTTNKGNDKPTVNITADTELIDGSISKQSDKTFNGVRARYRNIDTNEMTVIQAGETPFDDRGIVSELKAKDLINSYSSKNAAAKETINIILPSSNSIIKSAFAEGLLNVDINRFFKNTYVIDSVSMNEQQTTITGSLPK